MNNKLFLPFSIIISSIVIGIALYLVQVNKQESIERQQQAEFEEQRLYNISKQRDEATKKTNRDACIADADIAYQQTRELKSQCLPPYGNGVDCYFMTSDPAERKKTEAIDLCFRKFD